MTPEERAAVLESARRHAALQVQLQGFQVEQTCDAAGALPA